MLELRQPTRNVPGFEVILSKFSGIFDEKSRENNYSGIKRLTKIPAIIPNL